MRARLFVALSFSALLPVLGITSCSQNKWESKLSDIDKFILNNPSEATLMWINPSSGVASTHNRFNGYKINSTINLVDPAVRTQVLDAFQKGILESDGRRGQCFVPGHALRVKNWMGTRDFLISFECTQVWHDFHGINHAVLPITRSPEPLFDSLFAEGDRTHPPKGKVAVVVSNAILASGRVIEDTDVSWRFLDEAALSPEQKQLLLHDPKDAVGWTCRQAFGKTAFITRNAIYIKEKPKTYLAR